MYVYEGLASQTITLRGQSWSLLQRVTSILWASWFAQENPRLCLCTVTMISGAPHLLSKVSWFSR